MLHTQALFHLPLFSSLGPYFSPSKTGRPSTVSVGPLQLSPLGLEETKDEATRPSVCFHSSWEERVCNVGNATIGPPGGEYESRGLGYESPHLILSDKHLWGTTCMYWHWACDRWASGTQRASALRELSERSWHGFPVT